MAAVGAALTGSGFLPSGLVGLFILLLLLSVFLTALCGDCNRHSFELHDSKAEKHPSALIRVVKLEEVKENPMMAEIQKDEKEFRPEGDPAVSPPGSQQGALQTLPEPSPSEGTSAHVPPWRSHLMAPESRDPNGPAHIDHAPGDGRGSSDEALPPSANHLSKQLHYIARSGDGDSVYARVSRKLRLANPPLPTPEGGGAKLGEEEPAEESSPPLPDRRTWAERGGGSAFTPE